jgi:transposase-like protein
MKRKRHRLEEIAAKLQEGDRMAASGKLQSEIAQALGISVMTYHRWRKIPRAATSDLEAETPKSDLRSIDTPPSAKEVENRIAELEVENSRLRQLVIELLLEKVELDEVLDRKISQARRHD